MLRIPKAKKGISAAHYRSRIQEKETAERIGGHTTKASGASYEKGDVRLNKFVRIENKVTKHDSFSVTKEIIEKLEEAALGAGEVPIIHVELALGKHKVCIVPDYALEFIVEALQSRKL